MNARLYYVSNENVLQIYCSSFASAVYVQDISFQDKSAPQHIESEGPETRKLPTKVNETSAILWPLIRFNLNGKLTHELLLSQELLIINKCRVQSSCDNTVF